MNNEPVAWILNGIIHEFDPSDWAKEQYPDQDVIPLYTHPADLTDEEIYACFHQYFVLGEPKPTHYELEYEDLIDFARAILRKAQEK